MVAMEKDGRTLVVVLVVLVVLVLVLVLVVAVMVVVVMVVVVDPLSLLFLTFFFTPLSPYLWEAFFSISLAPATSLSNCWRIGENLYRTSFTISQLRKKNTSECPELFHLGHCPLSL